MSCGFDEVTAAVQAKEPVIVDVRTEDEFASGRIPGATNIPLSEVSFSREICFHKLMHHAHKRLTEELRK